MRKEISKLEMEDKNIKINCLIEEYNAENKTINIENILKGREQRIKLKESMRQIEVRRKWRYTKYDDGLYVWKFWV